MKSNQILSSQSLLNKQSISAQPCRGKGRFAPSPTGYMHLGNIWVALISYLHAKAQGFDYVLRIEDIDLQRSKQVYKDALLYDLEWLGIEWDEGPYYQSERYEFYQSILDDWRKRNLIYPCYCNRARLHSIASAPHGLSDMPIYDGHCRPTSKEETVIGTHPLEETAIHNQQLGRNDPMAPRNTSSSNRHPSWRMKVHPYTCVFDDLFAGPQSIELLPKRDDFVVERSDGMMAYQLAVVADDHDMGITEVIRGHDLLHATAYQGFLYQTLGYDMPRFGHVPLLIDESGYRLSKRQKSITIKEMREAGFTAERIWGHLLQRVGWIPPHIEKPTYSIKELLQEPELVIELSHDLLTRNEIILTKFDVIV